MYDFSETGTGRHRAPTSAAPHPLVPPDATWDPAEELAFMLQEGLLRESQEQSARRFPTPRDDRPADGGPGDGIPGHGRGAGGARHGGEGPGGDMPAAGGLGVRGPGAEALAGDPAAGAGTGSHLRNLQDITAELPPLKAAPRGHRKVRQRPGLARTVSCVIAAAVALIASAVSFISGLASYNPLRDAAESGAQSGVASWWPLLVYGPWLAASLSVLRAALHQRRAVHSWCVVLIFSSIAILLSVAQAPRTAVDISATALPGLASLACFQQLVRQITLTRPPHRPIPRHRLRPSRARAGCPGRDSVPRTKPHENEA
ncbi:DUF2637 domain-containing protein [Streptomyces bullii]|uniref:DUF2637 domain-containing protein n=1 Tax=Streptomyces bullii TaxID=349910 RepID=A0ABW0UTZ6_9ACTN